ncbi:MAG: hypothetical protein BMS9Abin33_1262 [Gammaproteobacteria bacterium]|nr:MAG: hypothetical protein BMS9Abin33_1262 [Gammaproteobacteria bacterium]
MSIETFLSPLCGENDILTPFGIEEDNHQARNYTGHFNLVNEIQLTFPHSSLRAIVQFIERKKFFNHMPAYLVQCRIPGKIWNNYFKFCVERNPWDKMLSHYYFVTNQK